VEVLLAGVFCRLSAGKRRFFEHAPLMCTVDCEKKLDACWLWIKIPWSMEFSVSYDEDSDPTVLDGYK
jgi:hypothetical protein